jgi:hypothetical protein
MTEVLWFTGLCDSMLMKVIRGPGAVAVALREVPSAAQGERLVAMRCYREKPEEIIQIMVDIKTGRQSLSAEKRRISIWMSLSPVVWLVSHPRVFPSIMIGLSVGSSMAYFFAGVVRRGDLLGGRVGVDSSMTF